MKSKKLKKLLSIATVSTMLSTIAPVAASAAWKNDSQNNWSFIEAGSKVTGWKQIDGSWYHFDSNGKMETGWVQTADSKWYYFNINGKMNTGWLLDTNGKWYYLTSSGEMKTGWLLDANGKWYYLASGGEMKTGWLLDTDGKWYFADISGAMQTGIINIEEKLYSFGSNGAMATGSTIVDGVTYPINANGEITGDKLPLPIKTFSRDGRIKANNSTGNTNTEANNAQTTSSSSSSSSSSDGSSSHHSSSNNSTNVVAGQDLSCDKSGTYGPASGTVEVNNVSVNSKDVVLKNLHIKGDLVLGEGIGEGDVSLQNVTVDGTTTVAGGGENSIKIINSILQTIIVNKSNGKIRLVAQGTTQISDVQLESPAKLEESDLTGSGFNDVTVTDSVQTGSTLQVQLIGLFHTVNSRSEDVRLLLPAGTNVQNLILNAAATIFGAGSINTARINSDDTTMSFRPSNMIINGNWTVILLDESGNTTETISDSYSNSRNAEITGMDLNMNSVKVDMSNFVSDLTTQDFTVSAKLDGQDYTLQNLDYDANTQRFTFEPVSLADNIGKTLEVTIAPASEKVTGSAQTNSITVQNGFTGRITDVQEVGISGVAINFRAGENSSEGEILATVTTDEDGYYTAYLAPGEYTGEISGSGIVTTYLYATSSEGTFNNGQDATAIRATSMNSIKIVLTWGERPRDEDSHLEGPTTDGGTFHTWYSDKIYKGEDGIRYADLDWDDITSYGPETTTIYKLIDGKYRFYVHNYSNEASLVGSDAKVEVYKGHNTSPINTFTIPNDTANQNARYWFVFDMTVSENGEIIDITPINELRSGDSILKLTASAETSYAIFSDYLEGVPSGTVADLKSDLATYDGGVLKVLAAGTYVYDAASFDAATELPDSTVLASNQIVAVKAQNGTVATYTIELANQSPLPTNPNPVLTFPFLTQNNSTTSSAVTLTWDKATDDATPQDQLEYSLYMAENSPYTTTNDWETNSTLLTRANDINSFDVTGLNDSMDYYFQLIVKDTDGNKTEYATEHRSASIVNSDQSPVLTSDVLTQESTTSSAVTLTWDKATDDVTSQNNLKYSLYMAEDAEYDNNIQDWEANAELLTEEYDINSFEVTELLDTITYYFKLIVEDENGNKTLYTTEEF